MSPRKKPEPGREALTWADDAHPTPLKPGAGLVYGWKADAWDGLVRLRAVVLDGGHAHADADAKATDDPRVLLAGRIAERHRGGWSQGTETCYATVAEALLAVRLAKQRAYAIRLATLDEALTTARRCGL